jgi:hypothetical protein
MSLSEHMTAEERAAAKARCAAADSEEEYSKGVVELTWTPYRHYQSLGWAAGVWFSDGDMCAAVFNNMGMGMDGNAWAEFFAHARADLPRALAELDRLEAILIGAGIDPVTGRRLAVEPCP